LPVFKTILVALSLRQLDVKLLLQDFKIALVNGMKFNHDVEPAELEVSISDLYVSLQLILVQNFVLLFQNQISY